VTSARVLGSPSRVAVTCLGCRSRRIDPETGWSAPPETTTSSSCRSGITTHPYRIIETIRVREVEKPGRRELQAERSIERRTFDRLR